MYSFPPFFNAYFQKLNDIHQIICVAHLLLMFAQRAPALITFSGASIPLFPSPSKACHSGNVLLQMDAKYLLVCVLGARHCHSLLGRRLKGKGVKKNTKGLARLHSPISSPSNTRHVRYRRVSDNLQKLFKQSPKVSYKSTLAIVYCSNILKTKFRTKRGTNDLPAK